MRKRVSVMATVIVALYAVGASADEHGTHNAKGMDRGSKSAQTEYKPDNTGRNSEEGVTNKTAEDQSNSDRSMEVTRSIREKIVSRNDLSIYAKNVKIVTDESGLVTLAGPVRSDDERKTIERIAGDIAGQGKVKSQLDVAAAGNTTGDEKGANHG